MTNNTGAYKVNKVLIKLQDYYFVDDVIFTEIKADYSIGKAVHSSIPVINFYGECSMLLGHEPDADQIAYIVKNRIDLNG